jgi:isopentenyldiphosphate isomerase
MDEVLIQVTENDEILGPVKRSLVHGNPMLIHRSVHVLVINSAGLLLLQKRSLRKDTQPGKWDTSVGGHVGFGQSYTQAAVREAEEELGLAIDLEVDPLKFLYFSRIRNSVESENIQTFLYLYSGPIRHDPEEIDEIRFWSRAEIHRNLGSGLFTPNFEDEFDLFLNSPHGLLLK